MSLAAIVTALRTTVDAITGIEACYPRVPETPPTVTIFAIIETPNGTIQAAGADLDRMTYAIDLHVATPRAGDLWDEQVALLPYVDSVPAALRSAFTLGGITYGTGYDDPAWELGELSIKDKPFLDVLFHLRYKQKATTTFSG